MNVSFESTRESEIYKQSKVQIDRRWSWRREAMSRLTGPKWFESCEWKDSSPSIQI